MNPFEEYGTFTATPPEEAVGVTGVMMNRFTFEGPITIKFISQHIEDELLQGRREQELLYLEMFL
jgi:hypothetical protein